MKKALALAVLAALAACVVFLLQGEKQAAPERAWPEYGAGGVDTIAVSAEAHAYELERKDEDWFMRLPTRDDAPKADAAKVSALLEFLTHNRPIVRFHGHGPADAVFGGGASLTINGEDTVEIGGPDSSGKGVYARRSGMDGVFLLASEYVDMLGRGPQSYLDLRLVEMMPEEIVSIVVKRKDETWEIDRGKDADAFKAPEALVPVRVRSDELDLWLHDIASLRAMDLAPQSVAPGREPDVEMEFRHKGAGGKAVRLEMYSLSGSDGPWTVTSNLRDMYFLLDPDRAIKVDKNAFSLVDRRLAVLDPGAAGRLLLSSQGRELAAVREGKGWRRQDTPDVLTGIDMLLWRLTDLQYEYGPVGALPASAETRMHLELFSGDGAGLLDFAFYTDTGLPVGQCWVSRGQEQGFYPVADQIFKDLQGLLPPAPEAGPEQ